jgi:predicted GIY-YIG superfamily endonuclease
MNPWYCYLLQCEDESRTYIGATNNPDRRLRQHNGGLSGGAKATHGRAWRRLVLVSGFPDNIAALQFEWAWKFRSRKRGQGLKARMLGLQDLLAAPQSTSKALPYSAWSLPPTIHTDYSLLSLPDFCIQKPLVEVEIESPNVQIHTEESQTAEENTQVSP